MPENGSTPNASPLRLRVVQHAFFIALLVGVSLAFLWIIQAFFQSVFWATVLAVLFYPVYRRLYAWLRERANLASVLTLIVIFLLVVVPLTSIGVAVTAEARGLYERISTGEIDIRKALASIEGALPLVDDFLGRFGMSVERVRQGLSDAALTASQYLASQALDIGQNALRVGVLFVLMFYLLFFFLRDGEQLLDLVLRALPLGEVRKHRLFDKFAEVSRATMKGMLIVGIVQGTLGGLLFWAVGIRAAVFWGVIMTLASLLPAVGSTVIWGPAALMLLATGDTAKGLVVIAVGMLLIGLIDNVLRPLLVGRETRMPDYLVLLATLGGLAVFGLSGFVIGPMIAALFLAVWQMFTEEYGDAGGGSAPGEASEDAASPESAAEDGTDQESEAGDEQEARG